MEKITLDEYEQGLLKVYKYLIEKHGDYIDKDILVRNNAEINLLVALAHPYLYLEEKLKK